MAIWYDAWKKSYSWMNDEQKQKYNDTMQQQGGDALARSNEFIERYNQENQTNTDSNFETPTINKSETPKQETPKQETYNFDPEEKLDTSMFWASDGKVVVKEWTAKDTGMPDYQLDSDARTREITDNLNAYRQTNREYFSDRNTYNNMFHYNERSDQQKAVLDSYWKKKVDMDNASKYNTADSINNWMKDADITPDQLNYIKEYSPEAYREWQQKQLDDINLRIANLATPADPTDTAELFNSLLQKLNLDPWDPYQIYDNWYGMCERLWVFSDSEKLKSYQNQLDANHSKMESIMGRYAASTWGTVSDALAAARMSKALAPYQQREVDLQNSYTTLLNGRNSNLAVANQSANALAMQAAEDQRIWNQRLSGLWFAMQTAAFRTPEQQAQLQLQTAQIQNDMNLLYQAKANDLNLYNQYATTKLQNQLQQELTDLSVEDEAQLKANLNNALSTYYQQYWDIIQRSQAQAVEDIIRYAKEKGISVAQAMTENFIKPLQNKPEYKQKIASSYGMLSQQSIGTINWKSVIMTTNPNWTISYQYIDELDAQGTAKPYNQVDSKVLSNAPVSYNYNTLWSFLMESGHQIGNSWWECWHFVNDYLEYIWVGRYYDDELSTKVNSVNSTIPTVWSVAVFDFNHKSIDWINHGHVGIVTKVNEDGSFEVTDSNYDTKNPWKIWKRTYTLNSSSLKWFFDPSLPPKANSYYDSSNWRADPIFEYNGTTYDFRNYPGWQELTDDEWITVQNLLTYQTNPASLPKSWSVNWQSNSRVRAAAAAIGRDAWYTEWKFWQADKVIKKWQDAAWPWGVSSANSTSMSILKNLSDSFSELNNYDINAVNGWINTFRNEFWDTRVAVYTDLRVAASEIAKALKWGASATTDEIKDIEKLLNWKLSTAQANEVFKHFAKNLYEKNESEALNFYRATWYKPDPIYTDSAAEWMANEMGIDLSTYYNYESSITTWPDDIRERYFSWLYTGTPTSSNINFILNG